MADPQFDSPNVQQFMELLPVTAIIAGLPRGEVGKYFNDDQMDLRGAALRRAYKHAQKLVKELSAQT